jgi:F-type H+-transporting ATPase subunit alpha
VNEGLFDELPPEKIAEATEAIRETVLPDHRDVAERIAGGKTLSDEDAEALVEAARKVVQEKFQTAGSNGEA